MNGNDRQPPGGGPRRPAAELDDPRVIEALDEYLAALEAGTKPDREAFLARHAHLGAALADCLDGMEALHEASSSSPRAVPAGAAGPDWQPGTPLGDYRIVREIGRGGMGVVYEAEQLSLGRRIALKVLPFALTLDPRQLQRFKNEARAAAQLHHPHIVPVHAVGVERGVHFYAMQYIDGRSLAEVIHGLRRLAGTKKPAAADRIPPRGAPTGPFPARPEAAAETVPEPAGALATAYSTGGTGFCRAVARLGVQAAEALEHAHDCGVIHRDVKPGNLLVDGHGCLWVTDFGLAQFHADVHLTQSGDLLGTLRYMSPEQAGGQRVLLDHRTDVYSLGATLYELLTLRPPFDGADRQTLLHQILNDEPRPPRAVEKSVPPELETIVLKALAKVPAERYASARELADDLGRFLDNQPIRARRTTAVQRLRKWVRRHPSVAAAGVAFCLLTTGVSLGSAELIRREQAKTQAAYDLERRRSREAEERFQLARNAVDEMLEVSEQELVDRPDLDGLRKRLLEHALVYYQELIEQRRGDPTAQKDLNRNRERATRILEDLAVAHGAWLLGLLKEEAVRDDLHLTDAQRTRISQLSGPLDRRWWEFIKDSHTLSPEQRRKQFLALARASNTEYSHVLTEEQWRRLQQIDLQLKGPEAFLDSDVATKLELTPLQRDQIREIEEKMHVGPGHWPAGGPPDDSRWSREQRRQEAIASIEGLLKPRQLRHWHLMTGEKYRGPARRCPPKPPEPDGPRAERQG